MPLQECQEAADLAGALLGHLHWWGTAWKAPEAGEPAPVNANNPGSTTLAVVQLLADVTGCHEIALRVGLCAWQAIMEEHAAWCGHAS